MFTASVAFVACSQGTQDRSELRDAILLEDGKTAVVSYSSRQVRHVQLGLLDAGGTREETVRHRAVLASFDLGTKQVTRLATFELGTGHDDSHMQLLWSLGDFVLLHGWFPTAHAHESDYALLNARTGQLDRLRLLEFTVKHGFDSFVDVLLVAADGSVAVTVDNGKPGTRRAVWLRRVTGAFEQVCGDGKVEGCSRAEIAYHEVGAKSRIAFRFADGSRRDLHAREYADTFTSPHDDRPRLLQVRGLPGRGHGPLPPDGPYLALGRREKDRWVEDPVAIDVGPLR